MERKLVSAIILALLLIGMLTLAFNVQTVKTEPTTLLSVYPPTSTALIGETFTVNVTITDVNNLFGWQFLMHFDPDVVQVDDVTEGPFLGSTGNQTFFATPHIDNDEGNVIVGGTFTPPFPEEGVTGNGILTTIVFNAASYGTTTLEFDKDDLYTYLREIVWEDSVGVNTPIPCEMVDAHVYVTYRPEYIALNATYHALVVNYSQLQSDFDDLKSRNDALTADLGTTRNLSYLFAITTVAFVATTAYLAIRKPKVKSE